MVDSSRGLVKINVDNLSTINKMHFLQISDSKTEELLVSASPSKPVDFFFYRLSSRTGVTDPKTLEYKHGSHDVDLVDGHAAAAQVDGQNLPAPFQPIVRDNLSVVQLTVLLASASHAQTACESLVEPWCRVIHLRKVLEKWGAR
jgi:hypothetical protein